jgi:hypothetical protein
MPVASRRSVGSTSGRAAGGGTMVERAGDTATTVAS